MKVLHIDSGREWRGGQQQVLYLTQGLQRRGVVSVVAAPSGSPLARKLRQQNLPVIEMPYHAPYAPRTVSALHRILADRTWQIVHTHTAHAHTLVFLAFRLPAARPYHRPASVISRRVDFVPARDPLTRLKYTTPGQYFICVSEAVRRILETFGLAPSSLFTVRSGIALPGPEEIQSSGAERQKLRTELGVPEKRFVLGNIAQFVNHKGHRHLLDALATVRQEAPDAHLVLLGSGELEPELRRQADALALDGHLTFAGQREGATRFLPALDLFVSSSIEEGLGTSILDAEAAGIPVVATRAGGIPEAVKDGVTGLLVRPGDSEELAQAILALWRSEVGRQRMGEKGRQWVRERFSEDRMVEETLAVYREVMNRSWTSGPVPRGAEGGIQK